MRLLGEIRDYRFHPLRTVLVTTNGEHMPLPPLNRERGGPSRDHYVHAVLPDAEIHRFERQKQEMKLKIDIEDHLRQSWRFSRFVILNAGMVATFKHTPNSSKEDPQDFTITF